MRERAREPMPGEDPPAMVARGAVEGTRGGEAAGNPVAAALLDTVERRSLARHLLSELVDGRSFDLYDDPMPTLAVLEAYVDATSGELIRLAASVLASRRSGVVDAATHAGRAYAFTGLLRAFALHASAANSMCRSISSAAMASRATRRSRATPRPACSRRSRSCARSRASISTPRAHLKSVPPEAAPAFLPAALVPLYLSRMERAGYDPFRTRIEVPQWRRQWALWRAARRGI